MKKIFSRTQLETLVLITVIICLTSTGAYAQSVLEEVLVTAQKREQNMQDVPISISAFTGEALQETVIKDIFDLQANVPGLRVEQSQTATTSSFAIRGVSTSGQNFGLESSVGLYVDGIYRSRQSAMINNMVDLEAVEILRGPQGTLFGKNTPSGAILFRTVRPSHETDGFVEVNVGDNGLLNLSAAASFSAIEDVLAFRFTGFSGQRDGIVDVDGFGTGVLNDRDRWGARVQALFTPNDDVTVRVIADYSEIDEICCAAMSTLDSITAKGRVNPDGSPVFGTDAILIALGGTVFSGDDYFDFRTALNFLPVSQNQDEGLSVDITWDLGDYELTSISAYRAFESLDLIDSDFTDVNLISTSNDSEQSSFSQELRLAYNGDKFNYVVGAYYFTQDLDLDYDLTTFTPFPLYLNTALGLNPFIAGLAGLSLATGGAFPLPAASFPTSYSARHRAEQSHDSWALFGQADFRITDTLTLTAGLRYTDENKDLSTVYTEFLNGVPVQLGPPTSIADIGYVAAGLAGLAVGDFSALADPAFLMRLPAFYAPGWGNYLLDVFRPRPDIDTSLSDTQVTGTAKLSWLANENTLFYVSYGTGYKSGGTNTDRINAAFDPLFDAETSDSFEVGIKADFPDQALRVNIAAYVTNVEDFQANSFTGVGFNLQNAGELETYGGELEVFWAPTDSLNINLAYARTIADYKTFKEGTCWIATPFHFGTPDPGDTGLGFCDRTGDRLFVNPEDFLMVSAKQAFNQDGAISSFILAEYVFVGDQEGDGNVDPLKFIDDHSVLNLRAGVHFEKYQLDLTLWGRNVLDEEIRRTTFDSPVQDGRLNAYPAEKSSFGISLNKRF